MVSRTRVMAPKPMKTIGKWQPKRIRRSYRAPVSYIPRFVGRSDWQAYDTNISLSSTSTMQYQTLFLPTPGTASNSRYGDRTLSKFLNYNIVISPNLNQTTTHYVRVIIYYDRQPNGANATTPAPLATTDTLAMPNVDLRYRFLILRDWFVCTTTPATSPPGSLNDIKDDFIQRGRIPLNDIVTQFTGSAGTIADVASGSINICCLSDGTINMPSVLGVSRIIFSS